ncbi:hypothetical protein CRG98_021364 [Punica granatum]|uniref:Uncharacterized protein n=1 Tax=Punica granatum TaxID=22663 RepID=A0A2I0JPR7_PUNGR|nr:hypothetical protein CRG98_021364 [Punica granatum]
MPRPPPKGVFDLAGLILLSLEFARVKGLKDSTSKCVAFCLSRGVASAAPLFVEWGKARFAPRCRSISVETHASRLNGLFSCLCLWLRGGYLFVGQLPRRSMRKGSKRNSQECPLKGPFMPGAYLGCIKDKLRGSLEKSACVALSVWSVAVVEGGQGSRPL